jgi:hypothetical protein
MQWLKDLWNKILSWFGGGDSKPVAWDKCDKASCWDGSNAQKRMMNMLSPGMSDGKFNDYMNWMKSRGCNTAHLFTSNKADGENAGYCIYGNSWDWSIDPNFVNLMKSRIDKLRKNGFGIVLWLFADDSSAWNNEAKKNFPQHLNDLKKQGLLDKASTIVVGLELNEYYNTNDVAKLVNATRAVYSGKIGTHHTSGKTTFAALGDLLFYQVNPGTSINSIVNTINSWKGKMPINMFEMERHPDRARSEAALAAGAFGVGNW